jgi:ectoine hydroxylase-related dioxygenase (phytanoyl-CoA dioxygenase family)
MFTHQQIAHFQAFGYVVLPGLLGADEIAGLRAEVTSALDDAFGTIGRASPDEGGVPGDYLPLSADRARLSQALIADDPRLFQGSTELLGRPTVPTPPIATCFTGRSTPWHTDQGPDIGGLKFLVHLEPRTAETGALRVLPGSQDPGFAARAESYWSADPGNQGFEAWPAPTVVLPTEPGDALAFDLHLRHSAIGGGRRLAWTIEYLPWPGLADPERMRVVRDLVDNTVDDVEPDHWPKWREWAAGASAATPSRQVAVDRLRLLGVL